MPYLSKHNKPTSHKNHFQFTDCLSVQIWTGDKYYTIYRTDKRILEPLIYLFRGSITAMLVCDWIRAYQNDIRLYILIAESGEWGTMRQQSAHCICICNRGWLLKPTLGPAIRHRHIIYLHLITDGSEPCNYCDWIRDTGRKYLPDGATTLM